MSEEDSSPRTFSEKLATRPRARFFFTFALLGLTVTPIALTLIFYHPETATDTTSYGGKPVRLEAILGAILLALHLLSIFFAWMFYRDEGRRAPENGRD